MSTGRFLWRWHWRLRAGFLQLSFAWVLPLAARLGLWCNKRWARALARLTGELAWRLDVDWRTVALRQHFVAERTRAAVREIWPGATATQIEQQVRRRFLCAAQEELDGHYFALDAPMQRECVFDGLAELQAAARQGGMVILTLHFDTTLMGVVQLGRQGLCLNLMTSAIVEDARVPAVVQRFFRRKYEGIARHLNGGHYWHSETHMRDFYRALQRGEGAVVLCEAPASQRREAFMTDFLGRQRAFMRGALRMAEKTGAAVVGMICTRVEGERYRITLSPVYTPGTATTIEEGMQAVYGFLSRAVQADPGRWWAADLLPSFVDLTAEDDDARE